MGSSVGRARSGAVDERRSGKRLGEGLHPAHGGVGGVVEVVNVGAFELVEVVDVIRGCVGGCSGAGL